MDFTNSIFGDSLYRFRRFLPFTFILKMHKHLKLFLPLYHTVSDKRIPHIVNLFSYPDVNHFKRDLDIFQKYFCPISISELINYLKGNCDLPDRSLLLSFDDGYREVYDVIAPILIERSFPAVFFISSATLDNKEMLYRNKVSLIIDRIISGSLNKDSIKKLAEIFSIEDSTPVNIRMAILKVNFKRRYLVDDAGGALGINFSDYLKEKEPYLSSMQIKTLLDNGFMIGSHSIDHPLFKDLSLEEQLIQALDSMNILKCKFSLPYNTFAFPFHDDGVPQDFFNLTHYDGKIDVSFGISGFQKGHCSNNLQRQSMEIANSNAIAIYKAFLTDDFVQRSKYKAYLP